MSTLKLGWLSRNSGRKFPIDDTATAVADSAERIEDDVITDLKLSWPESLGKYAFISFLSITDNIVSLGITVASDALAATNCLPIATAVVSKRTANRRVHRLSPMQAGVAGFVTFGDVTKNVNLTFSTPAQARISPTAGAPFATSGVTSLNVPGGAKLTGDITLIAGNDITLRQVPLETSGGLPAGTAIAIGLRDPSANNDTMSKYVGACNRRPESGNCETGNGAAPAIQTINGISAACDRTIKILFEGGLVANGTSDTYGENAIVVGYPHTVDTICGTKTRNPNIAAVLETCSEVPTGQDCEELPVTYKLDGSESLQTSYWHVHDSKFTHSAAGVTFIRRTSRNPAIGYVGGLLTYHSCGYDKVTGRTVSADVTVTPPAAPNLLITRAGAGVVVNHLVDWALYRAITETLSPDKLPADNNQSVRDPKIRVGVAMFPDSTAEFAGVDPNASYNYVAYISTANAILKYVKLMPVVRGSSFRCRISAKIVAGATELSTSLVVTATDLSDTPGFEPKSIQQVVKDFGPPVGRVGIFADVDDIYTVGNFSLT